MLHSAECQLKKQSFFFCIKRYVLGSSKKSAEMVLTEQHDKLEGFGRNFFLQYHMQ